MHLILKLLNGEVIETNVEYELVTIGRSSSCNVQVPHEGMSRQHCQIEVVNGEVFVTDLNSTNGVFIDGVRIQPSKRVPYQTYLLLAFGAVQSLQIELDSTKTSIPAPPKSSSQSKKDGLTVTKTKTILTSSKPESLRDKAMKAKKSKEEGISKSSFWIRAILILTVLGFFVYWSIVSNENNNNDDEDYVPETEESESTQIPD